MKSYLKVLIPSIPLVIAPTLITGCNRQNGQEYLFGIDLFHFEEQLSTDTLALWLKFDDWNYNWDTTDVTFTTKVEDIMTNYNKQKDKMIFIGYVKVLSSNPDYEIIDPEMAITLTENVSGTSLTYKFYLSAQIKEFQLEKYNFYKL